MDKKRVCIIAPLPPPMGGDAIAVKTIIDSKKIKEKFDFFNVNLSDGNLRSSSVKIFTLSKIITIIKAKNKIRTISKKNNIDTYYLTIAQTNFGTIRDFILLKTIYKIKSKQSRVVVHLHGGGLRTFYNSTNWIIKTLMEKFLPRVDIAIVLSESLVCMFDNIIDKDKIKIVENCVDNRFILSSEVLSNKIKKFESKKVFNIIYLSNMIKTKGYYDLLVAAKKLVEISNKVNFTFAGPFPSQKEKEDFLYFINRNNLSKEVSYLGVVDGEEKNELLLKGDIFVLPTYYPQEGQPISIIEAMAAGMPIITTSQGGICDIVTNRVNGLIIEPKNSTSIVNALIEITDDVELFRKISKNNIKKVMNNYLEEFYIEKIINLL